jgi:hypothetical protein
LAEERLERQKWKDEKEQERLKQHEDFKAMLQGYKDKHAAQKGILFLSTYHITGNIFN